MSKMNETDAKECMQEAKIKSDGGSSDYYKLEINGNLVEVEDVIYAKMDCEDAYPSGRYYVNLECPVHGDK